MIEEEKRDMWWLHNINKNNPMTTHRLKHAHRHDRRREKRYVHGGLYIKQFNENSPAEVET